MDSIKSVLSQAQCDIQSALNIFKTATDLDAEDEFEMEMLLDDLAKNATKVKNISIKYKKAESVVNDVTADVNVPTDLESCASGDSVNCKEDPKPIDENSNSVQDLEQIMLSSESQSQKSDAASDKTVERLSPAETAQANENRVSVDLSSYIHIWLLFIINLKF